MKRTFCALGLCVALLAGGAVGAEPLVEKGTIPGEFSASIALTNEYFFRGVSQTDDVPAIQGEVGYSHDIGVHSGLWASNVKFTDASIEIDYTAGFGREIGKASWDLSGIYYSYPGADGSLNYDYWEVAGLLGYDFGLASVTAGVNFSPEYFGDSGDATYASLGIEAPLGKFVTLGLNVGHQWVEDNAAFALPDYIDWGVSLSTEIEKFDLTLGYTDTDMSTNECDDACGQVLFTLSRSF